MWLYLHIDDTNEVLGWFGINDTHTVCHNICCIPNLFRVTTSCKECGSLSDQRWSFWNYKFQCFLALPDLLLPLGVSLRCHVLGHTFNSVLDFSLFWFPVIWGHLALIPSWAYLLEVEGGTAAALAWVTSLEKAAGEQESHRQKRLERRMLAHCGHFSFKQFLGALRHL